MCTDNSDTQKGAFNSKYGEGFDNWKKGAEKLKNHEVSFVHKAACAAMARAKRTIAATFSSFQLERQKQMLVIKARRNLLEGILEKDFYSILADESADGSKKEQLSFSVRTCNDDYQVSEDFLGICECTKGLSSDALLKYATDILLRSCLDGKKMAAMGFDGATAMKSLARKLKADVAHDAIYVHCFAHCNELIVKDAMKQCPSSSASLDLCQALYAIVGAYPKRVLLFEDVQKDFKYEKDTDEYKVLRLQSLSATRWTAIVKAADVIFEKTAELRTTLEMLKNDPSISSADTKMLIKGILKSQLSSLKVLFDLNVTSKLVCLLEKFSKELQAIDISADYAPYSLQPILQRLDKMRSEREFQHILNEARMEENCERDRRRKIPRWMENGDSVLTDRLQPTDTAEDGSIDQIRRSYYEAIDVIVQSVNERFNTSC